MSILAFQISPENEGWVLSGLRSVHFVGSIVLGDRHLHELGHVEGKGEGGDRHDVDQQPSRVGHRQADRSVLVRPTDRYIPKSENITPTLSLVVEAVVQRK